MTLVFLMCAISLLASKAWFESSGRAAESRGNPVADMRGAEAWAQGLEDSLAGPATPMYRPVAGALAASLRAEREAVDRKLYAPRGRRPAATWGLQAYALVHL